jgi:TrmH family RNA methyltransferase
MLNMGLDDLRVVAPRYPDPEQARALAHGAERVLDGARTTGTLQEALDGCTTAVACTARPRRWRAWEILDPGAAAALLARRAEEADCEQALVFGPEDNGLDNDELALATHLCHIPTHTEQSSLNLAQAVMVMAWEVGKARGGVDRRTTVRTRPRRRPRVVEVDGATTQIAGLLDRISFFLGKNRDQVLATVRQSLLRTEVTELELAAIRGAVRQMSWILDHPGWKPGDGASPRTGGEPGPRD